MSFLSRVAGCSLRDRVRSSVTREELGVEPLLLHIERGQLRWLGHLFHMPPGHLPGEVFRACPTGRRPRTRWRDYVFRLSWERLGILPEELEEGHGDPGGVLSQEAEEEPEEKFHVSLGNGVKQSSIIGQCQYHGNRRRDSRPHSWHSTKVGDGWSACVERVDSSSPVHTSVVELSGLDSAGGRGNRWSLESLKPAHTSGTPAAAHLGPRSSSSCLQLSKRDSSYSSFSTSLSFPEGLEFDSERSFSLESVPQTAELTPVHNRSLDHDPRAKVKLREPGGASENRLLNRHSLGPIWSTGQSSCESLKGAAAPQRRSENYSVTSPARPSSWSSLEPARSLRSLRCQQRCSWSHSSSSAPSAAKGLFVTECQLHTVIEKSPESSPNSRPKQPLREDLCPTAHSLQPTSLRDSWDGHLCSSHRAPETDRSFKELSDHVDVLGPLHCQNPSPDPPPQCWDQEHPLSRLERALTENTGLSVLEKVSRFEHREWATRQVSSSSRHRSGPRQADDKSSLCGAEDILPQKISSSSTRVCDPLNNRRGAPEKNRSAHIYICPNTKSAHIYICTNTKNRSAHICICTNTKSAHIYICTNTKNRSAHIYICTNTENRSAHVYICTNTKSAHIYICTNTKSAHIYICTNTKNRSAHIYICTNTENRSAHICICTNTKNMSAHICICTNTKNRSAHIYICTNTKSAHICICTNTNTKNKSAHIYICTNTKSAHIYICTNTKSAHIYICTNTKNSLHTSTSAPTPRTSLHTSTSAPTPSLHTSTSAPTPRTCLHTSTSAPTPRTCLQTSTSAPTPRTGLHTSASAPTPRTCLHTSASAPTPRTCLHTSTSAPTPRTGLHTSASAPTPRTSLHTSTSAPTPRTGLHTSTSAPTPSLHTSTSAPTPSLHTSTSASTPSLHTSTSAPTPRTGLHTSTSAPTPRTSLHTSTSAPTPRTGLHTSTSAPTPSLHTSTSAPTPRTSLHTSTSAPTPRTGLHTSASAPTPRTCLHTSASAHIYICTNTKNKSAHIYICTNTKNRSAHIYICTNTMSAHIYICTNTKSAHIYICTNTKNRSAYVYICTNTKNMSAHICICTNTKSAHIYICTNTKSAHIYICTNTKSAHIYICTNTKSAHIYICTNTKSAHIYICTNTKSAHIYICTNTKNRPKLLQSFLEPWCQFLTGSKALVCISTLRKQSVCFFHVNQQGVNNHQFWSMENP
ncbi:hypothetical protein WMY93_021086 [Mugilogobius chulae]|uniref:Uncharacterized protein n=1 Tax=Mugilogobius chulae TaxID=88201 RepID=A0AAW0NDY6_9GOBI